MKKIYIILAVFSVGIALWAGNFYYKNLRGVGPSINPPPSDITQIPQQDQADESGTTISPKNNMDFPLKLPGGFTVSIFAKNLGNPRVLAWDSTGSLLVSVPSQGRVAALVDGNNDGVADGATTVASGLNQPHGLAFHEGKLYIAETNQVAVYTYDTGTKKATDKKKIIDLSSGGNHFSRTIGFGPDGRLYISVGSTCNVCVESNWQRAKILVANADGSDAKVFASGLRNSVFFVWHPKTLEMWATDMGRDLIGDNIPPEEVNIVKEGSDYGWPYCYSQRTHDASFDPSGNKKMFCTTTIPAHIEFQAHSAPLGIAFIPDSWPVEYRGDLLVSYHGSWNRTEPTGYKVARFDLEDTGKSKGESDFLTGFLEKNGALGRPVDLLFDAKGVLYVSDDKVGVVYRISRK